VVRDGLVVSVARYPDLAGALRAAGIHGSPEVPTDHQTGTRRVRRGGREALRATDLSIRRYEPEDREAVWRLHNEALDEVGAHLGNGSWDDDLHGIEATYLEAGGEFLVGVLDGRVVAMGALRRIWAEEAEVKRMEVELAIQGRGPGQALLDGLHRLAAKLSYSTLRLDTVVHQRAARSLYERNGYREIQRGRIGPFGCIFYERNPLV